MSFNFPQFIASLVAAARGTFCNAKFLHFSQTGESIESLFPFQTPNCTIISEALLSCRASAQIGEDVLELPLNVGP